MCKHHNSHHKGLVHHRTGVVNGQPVCELKLVKYSSVFVRFSLNYHRAGLCYILVIIYAILITVIKSNIIKPCVTRCPLESRGPKRPSKFFVLKKKILGLIGQLLGLCKCKKALSFRGLCPLTPWPRALTWSPLGALLQITVIDSRSARTTWLPKLWLDPLVALSSILGQKAQL